MRHKRKGRKLGVTTKHRRSMLRNLVTDLFRNERIKTTDARAKEVRRVAEKYITLSKKGTLHARRLAATFIKDKDILKKLFDELSKRYSERPGGYTRIVKLGVRVGDNASISLIELIEETYKPKKKKSKKTTKKTSATASAAKSTKKESAEELGLTKANKGEEEKKTEVEAKDQAEIEPESKEVEETSEGAEEKVKEASAKDEPEKQQDTETTEGVPETEEAPTEPEAKSETEKSSETKESGGEDQADDKEDK